MSIGRPRKRVENVIPTKSVQTAFGRSHGGILRGVPLKHLRTPTQYFSPIEVGGCGRQTLPTCGTENRLFRSSDRLSTDSFSPNVLSFIRTAWMTSISIAPKFKPSARNIASRPCAYSVQRPAVNPGRIAISIFWLHFQSRYHCFNSLGWNEKCPLL